MAANISIISDKFSAVFLRYSKERKKGSEMGSSIRIWGLMITVFVSMMLAQNATGQSLYACWGGCYNVCFLLGGKPLAERYPCYLNCLSSCFPQSALENQLYYCHVGCSAQRCLQVKNASAREKCFGGCGDVCKT